MNPAVQRFLPPALVFGAAAYFGWPPSPQLDLGDDLVKAKAVRWHKNDLIQPPLVTIEKDPFLPVLVAEQSPEANATEVTEVVSAPEPVGPTPERIQSELLLAGVANMAGRPWAIINGRARLPGDIILTNGSDPLSCEIVSVHADHAVVRCQKTLATIRPVPQGSRRDVPTESASTSSQLQRSAISAEAPPPAIEPTPPQS